MKSFSFSDISRKNNTPVYYSTERQLTDDDIRANDARLASNIQNSLDIHNITGEALPNEVVNFFKNQTESLGSEVVKLSDYLAEYPNSQYKPDLEFKTTDFFGKPEVYVLAKDIPEYHDVIASKSIQKYNEFAKPFIAHDPSLAGRLNDDLIGTIGSKCAKIMDNHINKQTEIKMDIFNNSIWGDAFPDSIRKDFVSRLSGALLAEDLGLTPHAWRNNRNDIMIIHKEIGDIVCKGQSPEFAVEVIKAFNQAAENQIKDFKQKYNELRPEFDKSQPFKNQAFDIVDKLSDKFNQAVQGLKKVWQVVTTKNLAIEQSKDKQQTVQPQKNTPEVKQQSKAKDMER